ncbi:hypothetical protein U9M48_039079 [Paspalum notatum var. saurae]|uniref:Uncharacterized protein n=1 Tax=Paspalum notatum var. saurae TaxID=547442 RepID=A0AAQ3XB17_PASNO
MLQAGQTTIHGALHSDGGSNPLQDRAWCAGVLLTLDARLKVLYVIVIHLNDIADRNRIKAALKEIDDNVAFTSNL